MNQGRPGKRSRIRACANRCARSSTITSPICWDAGRVYYLIWGAKVVTKAMSAQRGSGALRTFRRRLLWLFPLLLLHAGCVSLPWSSDKKLDGPDGPADSLVLRGGGLEKDKIIDGPVYAELESAKRLYQ